LQAKDRLHSCGHSAGFSPASLSTAPGELAFVGGTLIADVLGARPAGCQIGAGRIMQATMTANHSRLLAILIAIVGAAALRLVPHPPNFTPIGAMALFSGAYLARRGLAYAVPLAAMLLSDALIGFHSGMPFVYGSVALIVLIGQLGLRRVSSLTVVAASLMSSVLFFVVTNFGTWAVSGMYPLTPAGLATCYVAAIPFFQNTVVGDLFYSAALFGGFALLERAIPAIRRGAKPQAA
jgi:hypothetical protein